MIFEEIVTRYNPRLKSKTPEIKEFSQGKQASHLIAWGDQSSVCPSIEGSRDVATFIGSPISGTAAAAIPI